MPVKARVIRSDLAKVDKLRDEDIDYRDIPELDNDIFAQPLVPWPPKKATITIRVDADVLGWFKRQGRGYQTRMNQVLRRYVDVTGRRTRPGALKTRRASAHAGARNSKRTR